MSLDFTYLANGKAPDLGRNSILIESDLDRIFVFPGIRLRIYFGSCALAGSSEMGRWVHAHGVHRFCLMVLLYQKFRGYNDFSVEPVRVTETSP
jgi:hypothetical protein